VAGYWDRILNYVRGGPTAIDGWPEQIPAAEFARAVGLHLGSVLTSDGFEQVSARRWVRSSMAPIRHVAELQALKGLSYCPQWGLSLDFVPHVTGRGEIRWHRTAKAARFDFVYRPIDFEATRADTREWAVSPLATPQELEEDLRRVAMLTVRDASLLFDRAVRVEDLPALYREHRARPAVGLPFAAFPQQVLAEAFVAARCCLSSASPLLEEYFASYDVPAEPARKLRELLEEARGGPTRS
jgi:hypothetical protein